MTEPLFRPVQGDPAVGNQRQESKDALSFALLLKRECARVRWLTHNPFPVTEDA